jgi:hypothetical protein
VLKYFLVLILLISATSAYALDDATYQKLQEKRDSYNRNVDRVPSILKFLFGNERINVVLLNEGGVPNGDVLGIVSRDGLIVQLSRSQVSDPTVKARMKESLLKRLLDSHDARGDFIIALKNGEIEVEGVGFLKRIKLSLTLMLAKLIL